MVLSFLAVDCSFRQFSWSLRQPRVVCIYHDVVVYEGSPRAFYKYTDGKWYIEDINSPDLILPGNCEIK